MKSLWCLRTSVPILIQLLGNVVLLRVLVVLTYYVVFLSSLKSAQSAVRSSWSRGSGRTGSSSSCWDSSWLWSAGWWTSASPSAYKVSRVAGRETEEETEGWGVPPPGRGLTRVHVKETRGWGKDGAVCVLQGGLMVVGRTDGKHHHVSFRKPCLGGSA